MKTQEETKTTNQPQVMINAQYIKDLSFDIPDAPACFSKVKTQPKIDLALDVQAKKIEENSYEIALKITAKALNEQEVLFNAELEFAGLFSVTNCENEEQKEQILLIYCPSLLFPFARRIIADVTRDGGFQPLMINPIDFAGLYMQQKANKTIN